MTENTAAVIRDCGKFLICQHKDKESGDLLWDFVGGEVKESETKEQALIRQCKDLLGIEIKVGNILFETISDVNGVSSRKTVFFARITSGTVSPQNHNKTLFITADQISDSLLLNKIVKF